MPNKSYAYLLNVEPSNLVFLKTYSADSDETIIRFTDQNGRPLELEGKVNLTLLIDNGALEMARYSIELGTRKC